MASKKLEEQKFRQKEGASVERAERDHGSEGKPSLLSRVHRSPSLESRSAASDHDTVSCFFTVIYKIGWLSYLACVVVYLLNGNPSGKVAGLKPVISKQDNSRTQL